VGGERQEGKGMNNQRQLKLRGKTTKKQQQRELGGSLRIGIEGEGYRGEEGGKIINETPQEKTRCRGSQDG